jgi:hypothetical protein
VLLVTVTLVADVVPNVTVAPEMKFAPVIVTPVPPEVGPLFGNTFVTVGAEPATYVKALARLPPDPPALVTVTVTAPIAFAGVVAVIVVLFATETLVAAVLPNVTAAPEMKFVPEIVTAVPPAAEPLFGETPVTVGVGTT